VANRQSSSSLVGVRVYRGRPLTDLMPALETVAALGSAVVEVAAWRRTRKLRFPGSGLPWCHVLDRPTCENCRDYTMSSTLESGTPPIPEDGGEQ
jgi:hypothetical protein